MCGFGIGYGIGYGIGQNYRPIRVSVSVSDRNQNSGFGRSLGEYAINSPAKIQQSTVFLLNIFSPSFK